jgi:ADP-ribose pyrophosphatase
MERWIQKTEIYKGPIFSVETGVVELDDGSTVERQVVRHQGSVGIVAILDDGIIFVRQPRIAVSKQVLEIPAGRIEKGEDPRIAALRELAEETGYQARKLIPGPEYYSSVGFLDEQVHLFLAIDLHPVKVDDRKERVIPDKKQEVKKDEGLSQLLLSVAEVEKKLGAHEFEDSKTIIGLQHALEYIKKRNLQSIAELYTAGMLTKTTNTIR